MRATIGSKIASSGSLARSSPTILTNVPCIKSTSRISGSRTANPTTVIANPRTYPFEQFDQAMSSNYSMPGSQISKSSPNIPSLDLSNRPNFDLPIADYTAEDALLDVLVKQNVKQTFCQSGPGLSRFFDSIHNSDKISSIMARHEQGAGHMAEGYTRATGEPGVVLVTSGSGATNLVTPMQDALCDGTAMVVICGQAPRKSNRAGNFLEEEADIIGISKSCTKWNIMVKSLEDLPRRMEEAFEISKSGRPGPVLVYIPRDVAAGVASYSIPMDNSFMKRLNPSSFFPPTHSLESIDKTLDRIARLIRIAKKPLLYVGQGMLARPEGPAILKEFADKACIPVTTSLQGLGAFDELDPKALHMLGLHGAAYANLAIQNADLIIALGARFDDRITGCIPKFAPQALVAARGKRGGIVHFEIAPKNINKVVQATESIVGDCTNSLTQLIPRIDPVADRPEWLGQIQKWKTQFPFSAYNRHPTTPMAGLIRAQAVVEKLSDMTAHMKERTIITTGVGQHQMWAAQQFRWQYPRTMITSGGLGTMGYGLPAAIGAKIARPDCVVIDIDGDASFNMTMSELLTAAKYNIGVKVLLFNNEQMGMVSDLQRLYYNNKFVHNRQTNPDFLKLSQAFGVGAARCSEPDDVEAKLKWLLEHDGPAVLEVMTEQNSPVWPVVPAGKGLDEFVTYSALEVDGETGGS